MRSGRSKTRRILGLEYRFEIGKGRILRQGADVTIIACGVQVARALDAADLLAVDGIAARVVNMSTIKPLDKDLVARCSQETGSFLTADDHTIHGGPCGAVAHAGVRKP